MKQNIGTFDRIIRMLIGSTLVVIGLILLSEPWAVFALIAGAMMILFGLVGFCPPLALFGIDTRRQKQTQ